MIITSQTCTNEDGLARYRINQTTSGLELILIIKKHIVGHRVYISGTAEQNLENSWKLLLPIRIEITNNKQHTNVNSTMTASRSVILTKLCTSYTYYTQCYAVCLHEYMQILHKQA